MPLHFEPQTGLGVHDAGDRVEHFPTTGSDCRPVHIEEDAVNSDLTIPVQRFEQGVGIELDAEVQARLVDDLQLVHATRSGVDPRPDDGAAWLREPEHEPGRATIEHLPPRRRASVP